MRVDNTLTLLEQSGTDIISGILANAGGVIVSTPSLAAIEELVEDKFDGAVERPFLTALYTAKRL